MTTYGVVSYCRIDVLCPMTPVPSTQGTHDCRRRAVTERLCAYTAGAQ